MPRKRANFGKDEDQKTRDKVVSAAKKPKRKFDAQTARFKMNSEISYADNMRHVIAKVKKIPGLVRYLETLPVEEGEKAMNDIAKLLNMRN